MKSFGTLAAMLLLLMPVTVMAQPEHQDKEEKIEAMKIAFITKKLDLTPQEAQVFWPVYNEYTGKLEELRKKRRKDMQAAHGNFKDMGDKEVEAIVDGEMTFRQKELDLQKDYHGKFKSALPIKKVAKLYVAEEQFKRELLKIMRENHQGHGPGGKGSKKHN